MPTTYTPASTETLELLASVREQYHPHLIEAKVKIGVLMAHAPRNKDGEPTGKPAIRGHAGATAAGKVKIVPLADRVVKQYDAEITICADTWDRLSDAERVALLDHEQNHITLVKDKDGNVKRDDLNRPKLKLRNEDFICWGFREVIQRHGKAALEHRALKNLMDDYGQYLLPGFTPNPSVGRFTKALEDSK